MNYPLIFSLSLFLNLPSALADTNFCTHIFDEVQRTEQLASEELEPLRAGCEGDVKAMSAYWQCMDQNMAQQGYKLENMLSLGDVCKDAGLVQTSELATQ